jgi:hypothetical protein
MGKPDDISEEAWKAAQSTDADINAMCMTWRHDFGLNARDADADDRRAWSDGMSVGMTQAERDGLRLSMRQVWHHCVAPVVARAIDAAILSAKAEERERCALVAQNWRPAPMPPMEIRGSWRTWEVSDSIASAIRAGV